MQLEFARPVAKEETAAKRENPGDLPRVSLSLISECMGEKHLRSGKKHPKRLERRMVRI